MDKEIQEKGILLNDQLREGKITVEEYTRELLKIAPKQKYGDWRDLPATDI